MIIKAIVVGADLNGRQAACNDLIDPDWSIDDSLSELSDLLCTAGITVIGRVVQKRDEPDPKYYLGHGKILEALDLANSTGADYLVFDDELNASQIRNIEELVEIPILDRTQVILDIFAQRAVTREGQIQVELAQLNYTLPRLRGANKNLSRLGGGIGTRGPGESKLETDRRKVKDKIRELTLALDDIVKHRKVQRQLRSDTSQITGSLIGYTNAGKSTILNRLTGSSVVAEDKLFATLDTTTRKLLLPSGRTILLTDTVGFIRKLPHTLIAAFRATLEEVIYSDFLLHVIDVSDEHWEGQKIAAESVLRQLGIDVKLSITVFNKIDTLDNRQCSFICSSQSEPFVKISAVTGEGLDSLLQVIDTYVFGKPIEGIYEFPYDNIGAAQGIRLHGEVVNEEYCASGLQLTARLNPKHEQIYSKYRIGR